MNAPVQHPAGFTQAFKRELSYYRRNMSEWLFSISILLASMVAVMWIFSAQVLTDLPVAVIDNDNSSVSRSYTRMLEATPEMRVVDKLSSATEARELLQQASIYAYVIIPANFGKDLKTGRQATVVAWHSGQFLTMSGVLTKSLRQVAGTLSAGIEMSSLTKRGTSSLLVDAKFEPIQTELRTLFNPFLNYQYFLAASLLPAMLQVLVMLWTVNAVGREFRDNTSHKWLASGGSIVSALCAKALPVLTLAVIISFVCLIWLHGITAWPINGSVGLLILSWVLMICAYISLGILFASLAPTLATALSCTVFFTAPAFAYVGITFPQQAMPLLAQLWTYVLPIRTMLRLQVEQVNIGAPIINSMPEVLILLGFILLPLPFAIKRIQTRCNAAQRGA